MCRGIDTQGGNWTFAAIWNSGSYAQGAAGAKLQTMVALHDTPSQKLPFDTAMG
jgi:hypothetical protein